MKPSTYSFSHLSPSTQCAHGYHGRTFMYQAGQASLSDEAEHNPREQHSEAHWIAVSQEAKNNPIYALKLIQRNVLHESAIARLAGSPRQLSQYTKRKMEATFAGWELLDDEDKNLAAFHNSLFNYDSNGYRASLRAASLKLEKYIEPMTEQELQALLKRIAERNNVHSAEKIAERRQDEEDKRKTDEIGKQQRKEYRRLYGS
ncbi:hypothetical protein ABN242_04995 [Providencia alcalifaciens]|uniref:hypothetical protein n=1 Tax=Providencia alcalifaciens TaxID=126385 RepID=UPI0032DB04C4